MVIAVLVRISSKFHDAKDPKHLVLHDYWYAEKLNTEKSFV